MTKYLRYVLRNIEPVRIADDSSSQSGQKTTLRYIPGTTIRGLIINKLATKPEFEDNKKLLLSDKVRYLNAYPMSNEGKALLPSLKGFYEDKAQTQERKEIENVVIKGKFTPGYKRASLGRFCDIQNDTLVYCNVNTSSDMKIKINLQENEKQNVFRNECITANHIFVGYIAIDTEELQIDLKDVLKGDIILGNARSAGLGKCKILKCEYVDELPFNNYLPKEEQIQSCYMMLLSNTTMRDEQGELCGIHLGKLQEKMGVDNLKIAYCATSTVNVKGYNRTWGVKIPSAMMFESGSVFHLTFEGRLKKEKIQDICNQGIGIRRNEGFGRVLFLNEYENIIYKQQGECKIEQDLVTEKQEDTEVLTNVAKCYYRNKLREKMKEYIVKMSVEKDNLAFSQLGKPISLAMAHKYEPEMAIVTLKKYFEHAEKKENKNKVQKERASIKALKEIVENILTQDLEQTLKMKRPDSVMGIPLKNLLSESDMAGMKLELLGDMVKYLNKEDK